MADRYQTGVRSQMIYRDKILVARPILDTNPVFSHSVVYCYEHRDSGDVLGVILNKPSQFRVSSLGALKDIKIESHHLDTTVVHKGGPVSDTSILLLHTSEWTSTNTLHTTGQLAMTSDNLMVEKLGTGNFPKGWRMFAGMSVWTESQLDREVKEGAWHVMDTNIHLIFDFNEEEQYVKAIEYAGSQTFAKFL